MNDFANIKTVERAYSRAGRKPIHYFPGVPRELQSVFRAFYDLLVVTEALNMSDGKKWIPDTEFPAGVMDDKYLIVMEMFRKKVKYHGYHCAKSLVDLSHSRVFALRSLPVVEHFAKYFVKVHAEFMLACCGEPVKGVKEVIRTELISREYADTPDPDVTTDAPGPDDPDVTTDMDDTDDTNDEIISDLL